VVAVEGWRPGPSTSDEPWPRAPRPGSRMVSRPFLADKAGGQPAGTGGW